MKLYGGIDLHSNNCVIAIINEQGETLTCKRLNNDTSVILSFLHYTNTAKFRYGANEVRDQTCLGC